MKTYRLSKYQHRHQSTKFDISFPNAANNWRTGTRSGLQLRICQSRRCHRKLFHLVTAYDSVGEKLTTRQLLLKKPSSTKRQTVERLLLFAICDVRAARYDQRLSRRYQRKLNYSKIHAQMITVIPKSGKIRKAPGVCDAQVNTSWLPTPDCCCCRDYPSCCQSDASEITLRVASGMRKQNPSWQKAVGKTPNFGCHQPKKTDVFLVRVLASFNLVYTDLPAHPVYWCRRSRRHAQCKRDI